MDTKAEVPRVVLPCACESAFQDKHYGKGQRLHTAGIKDASGRFEKRCTVCGSRKP